jgi:hypothetical protein
MVEPTSVSGRRRLDRGEGFDQQQGEVFPAVIDVGRIANERENEQIAPANPDHFRMVDIERSAAVHADAERPKGLRIDVSQHFLRRQKNSLQNGSLRVQKSALDQGKVDCSEAVCSGIDCPEEARMAVRLAG